MKPGTKPKLSLVKKRNGNPGKKGLNPNTLNPAYKKLKMPSSLNPTARRRWKELVAALIGENILGYCGNGIIAAAATAYARWYDAEKQLRKMSENSNGKYAGVITTKQGNLIQNPLVGISNAALAAMVKYESELGLTPVARERLHLDKEDEVSLGKMLDMYAAKQG